jgi:hypothetical protein
VLGGPAQATRVFFAHCLSRNAAHPDRNPYCAEPRLRRPSGSRAGSADIPRTRGSREGSRPRSAHLAGTYSRGARRTHTAKEAGGGRSLLRTRFRLNFPVSGKNTAPFRRIVLR